CRVPCPAPAHARAGVPRFLRVGAAGHHIVVGDLPSGPALHRIRLRRGTGRWAPVEIGILGLLRVAHDGRPVAIGARRLSTAAESGPGTVSAVENGPTSLVSGSS